MIARGGLVQPDAEPSVRLPQNFEGGAFGQRALCGQVVEGKSSSCAERRSAGAQR